MTNPHIPDGYDTAEAFLDEARRRFQEGVDADRENREAQGALRRRLAVIDRINKKGRAGA